MDEKVRYKRLVFIIIALVVLSLFLTACILMSQTKGVDIEEKREWFFEESIQTEKEVHLDNAYILKGEEGVFQFIYEERLYKIQGLIDADYEGVADIIIDGDKIKKICIKPNLKNGTICAYSETELTLFAEEDIHINKKQDIPLYYKDGNSIVQTSWESIVIGASKVDCVMEYGQVCAIVIEETSPKDIRVIIKNKDRIFYDNLYIKKATSNTIINIAKQLEENNKKSIEIKDENGLYICDSNGQALGEMYEGAFCIQSYNEGYVLVNVLPIETYLKYVLPSEMPTDFHEEALKAQAVCARTFAYVHINNQSYAKYGANLDDSTAFQVYHKSGRYSETDKAVEDTTGEVITNEGELITCYYYSTSAGVTNDFSVWGSDTPAYIQMVESKDDNSPFFVWEAYLDVAARKDELGNLKTISVLERNKAGYITKLELMYEKEKIVLEKENEIRKCLGIHLKETHLNNGKIRSDLSMIPSAYFQVEKKEGDKIIIKGAGFGHGIGMSQYGANRLALQGMRYISIIEYYYKGIVVKNV